MKSLPVPENVYNALTVLESALSKKGDVRLLAAERKCRGSIEMNTANPDTFSKLSEISFAAGAIECSEAFLRHGISIFKHSFDLHCNLGNLLYYTARYQEALISYREAINIKQDVLEVHKRIAQICIAQKNIDQLNDTLDQAIKIFPDDSSLLVKLGEARKMKGNIEDAIYYFRKALKAEPENAYIYQTLSHTKKFESRDDDMKNMEAFLARDNLESDKKIRLEFSLGKAYEDLGNYEESFSHYKNANDEKRSSIDFNIEEHEKMFSSLKQVFDVELFERFRNVGFDSGIPVFIVGMPRSGSTLIEQMLASHPGIYGAGELSIMHDLINYIWNHQQLKGQAYPRGVDAIPPEVFSRAGTQYIHNVLNVSGENQAARIIDKLPHNFLFIGMIRLLLPNAKVIHCRRKPEDTCLSLYKHFFSSGHGYSFDLRELGRYYRLYADLMQHWHRVLPGFICNVNYEDLVGDQRGQLERMLTFCELPWDESCMHFHESENRAITASSMQVIQPVYNSAVNYWRRYEKFLQPLLDELHAA